MKKRIESLENALPPVNPRKVLIKIGIRWRAAVFNDEFKKAITIRSEAQPIFDKFPGLRTNRPRRCPKELYIDWGWFAHYKDRPARAHYNTAAIEGCIPDNFEKWKAQQNG